MHSPVSMVAQGPKRQAMMRTLLLGIRLWCADFLGENRGRNLRRVPRVPVLLAKQAAPPPLVSHGAPALLATGLAALNDVLPTALGITWTSSVSSELSMAGDALCTYG